MKLQKSVNDDGIANEKILKEKRDNFSNNTKFEERKFKEKNKRFEEIGKIIFNKYNNFPS